MQVELQEKLQGVVSQQYESEQKSEAATKTFLN
jgi:hypothetical protein